MSAASAATRTARPAGVGVRARRASAARSSGVPSGIGSLAPRRSVRHPGQARRVARSGQGVDRREGADTHRRGCEHPDAGGAVLRRAEFVVGPSSFLGLGGVLGSLWAVTNSRGGALAGRALFQAARHAATRRARRRCAVKRGRGGEGARPRTGLSSSQRRMSRGRCGEAAVFLLALRYTMVRTGGDLRKKAR